MDINLDLENEFENESNNDIKELLPIDDEITSKYIMNLIKGYMKNPRIDCYGKIDPGFVSLVKIQIDSCFKIMGTDNVHDEPEVEI